MWMVLLLVCALCKVTLGLGFLAADQELIVFVAILGFGLAVDEGCESDRLHAKSEFGAESDRITVVLECAGETDPPPTVMESVTGTSMPGKLLEVRSAGRSAR